MSKGSEEDSPNDLILDNNADKWGQVTDLIMVRGYVGIKILLSKSVLCLEGVYFVLKSPF